MQDAELLALYQADFDGLVRQHPTGQAYFQDLLSLVRKHENSLPSSDASRSGYARLAESIELVLRATPSTNFPGGSATG